MHEPERFGDSVLKVVLAAYVEDRALKSFVATRDNFIN